MSNCYRERNVLVDKILAMCPSCDYRQSIRCERKLHLHVYNSIKRHLRVFQLSGLFRRKHAQSGTNFHPHPANLADHLQDSFKPSFPASEVPPSGPHAKAGASIRLRLSSSFQYRLEFHQAGSLCRCGIS